MDKNWYRNPSKSEVFGRCGGDEKTTQNGQNSNAKKKRKKVYIILVNVCSKKFMCG